MYCILTKYTVVVDQMLKFGRVFLVRLMWIFVGGGGGYDVQLQCIGSSASRRLARVAVAS